MFILLDNVINELTIYLFTKKLNTTNIISPYFEYIKNTKRPIQCLKDNNTSENINGRIQALFVKYRVNWIPTTIYNPNQNRVLERYIRTLFKYIRNILFNSKLPRTLQGKVIKMIIYYRNRSPTRSLSIITLYKALISNRPFIGHLRIFGYIVYYYNKDLNKKKLDNKSVKYYFVKYDDINKFRLQDGKKIIVLTYIIFDKVVDPR